jgi:peptide deformylase
MVTIIQKENKILRQIAKAVPISDITKPHIQKILKDMNEALNREDDGIAIAAPQIGVLLRIFAVSGKAFDQDFLKGSSPFKGFEKYPNIFFINPKIIKISKDQKFMEEGCLSVRPLYGKVKRSTRSLIEAYNEKGEKITRGSSGLLSQIFQHEIDHLEGILFIDKAKDIKEVII